MINFDALFGGGSAPIGAIVSGQFAGDDDFLPCDGRDLLVASYPDIDKTGLATFGDNVCALRTMPATRQWGPVVYGNGVYLAITAIVAGAAGGFATSTDGVTWTSRTPPVAGEAYASVIFAAGLFVVVNTSTNKIYTSADGITWTLRYTASSTAFSGVAQMLTYGNGIFVLPCSGTTANYYTSPDGITWTARTSLPGSSATASGCSFAGGKFRIGTSESSGSVQYISTDGLSWSSVFGRGSGERFFDVGNVIFSSAGYRSFDRGYSWIADSAITGAFAYYNGLIFRGSSSEFQPAYGGGQSGGWRSLPGFVQSASFSTFAGNNKIIAADSLNAATIQTIDFDVTKFRLPIVIPQSDADRPYIRVK